MSRPSSGQSSLPSSSRPTRRANTPVPPPLITAPSTTLIIRFSQSLPDISLTVPHTLKVCRVKTLIRPRLPSPQQTHGLRLIHGGRLLEDSWSVRKALRLRNRPPPKSEWWDGASISGGKGKGRIADDMEVLEEEKIYVHCSLSAEPLSSSVLELMDDAELDMDSVGEEDDDDEALAAGSKEGSKDTMNTTTARSLGFDRLLTGTTGFTAADVASLRAQFHSVVAARHTPETMPSPTSLRRMEDAWLDTESFAAPSVVGGAAGEIGGMAGPSDEEDAVANLHDSFYGMVYGFAWPLGSLVWGLREEGVWSRRRTFAVFAGIGVNLGFGLVRLLN